MQYNNNVYGNEETIDTLREYAENMPPQQEAELDNSKCSGYIVFQVFSAGRAFPVSNAKVSLYRQIDSNIYFYKELLTDISGKTEPVCVYAPPVSLSQSPQNLLPYYSYQAQIEANGYDTVKIDDIRAFSGVTSIQPVALVPTISSL